MVIRQVPTLPAVIPASMHSGHALQKHREKDHIHADQGRPEMHFSPELAHLSSRRFWEPEVNAGEQSEDGARRYDVMKMRNDVVSVVQEKIGGIKRQGYSGESSNSKHREKGSGKQHRDVKTDRTAPQRDEKRAQDDDRRHRYQDRCRLEKCADGAAHTRHPHVMRPNDERKKSDYEHREDQRFITPEWFPRIVS